MIIPIDIISKEPFDNTVIDTFYININHVVSIKRQKVKTNPKLLVTLTNDEQFYIEDSAANLTDLGIYPDPFA